MARRRMIHPKFWQSRHWFRVKKFRTRLLFIGILSNADDEGRLIGMPQSIKSMVFPHDEIADKSVAQDLDVLCDEGLIRRYEFESVPYLQVVRWHTYQQISHPQKSDIPSFDQAELFGASKSGGTNPEPIRNDSGAVKSSVVKDSIVQERVKSDVGKSAPSEDAIKLSNWFHGEQRKEYPNQSIWQTEALFKSTVLRGVKAIDELINKRGWTEDRLVKVLKAILGDDYWRPRMHSLASMWKKMSNDKRKIENAEIGTASKSNTGSGPKQSGNRRTPADGDKSTYGKKQKAVK